MKFDPILNRLTGDSKRFMRLAVYGIRSVYVIFKIKLLIYQSKANLDVKILFGKITHYLDPEIKKILVRGMLGNENSASYSGP